MDRAHNLLQELLKTGGNVFCNDSLKLKVLMKESDEGYSAKKGHQILDISAKEPLSALFAWHQLKFAKESGRLKEEICTSPKFSARYFWPQGTLKEAFLDENLHEDFARRLIEWGYNGVVLEGQGGSVFHAFGLKVFKREKGEFCDGVIWEVDESLLLEKKYTTLYERFLAEIKNKERSLSKECPLFLVFPNKKKWTSHFSALTNDLAPHTKLVVSLHEKGEYADWEPLHPCLSYVEQMEAPSGTPLLCMINGGSIGFGEGLWPALPFDLLDQGVARLDAESFSGAFVLSRALPKQEGILSCQLWMIAQKLWSGSSADSLAEQWFTVKKPSWNFSFWREWMAEARAIVKVLGSLKEKMGKQPESKKGRDLNRYLSESLLSRIKVLEEVVGGHSTKPDKDPSLHEYFSAFIRDAKRNVIALFHAFNLPLSQVLIGVDDGLDGFWTQPGIKGNPPRLLEAPLTGKQGSRMHLIYSENR